MTSHLINCPTILRIESRNCDGKGVLGYRLKKARMDKGMDLIELSRQSGINVSTITGFENRRMMPRLDTIIALAMVLNCSLDYLVGLEDENGKREDRPLRKTP